MDSGPFQHHQFTKSTMLPRLSLAQLPTELHFIMPPCFRPPSQRGVMQSIWAFNNVAQTYFEASFPTSTNFQGHDQGASGSNQSKCSVHPATLSLYGSSSKCHRSTTNSRARNLGS
eukprot:scaffold26242_cov50-Attheya_sp.AAC.1